MMLYIVTHTSKMKYVFKKKKKYTNDSDGDLREYGIKNKHP